MTLSNNGVFNIKGYDSFSGCDMIVTARLSQVYGHKVHEKVYSLGSLQTLSISTHQEKKPIRAIGNMNAIDYTMGQRTIAGSMVFAVFDRHFASEIFKDLKEVTGKSLILPDELPPMDITITFANEYGRTSRMAVYGVRLINEGQVMSINDIYTENTYQFVANALEPLNKGETTGSKTSNKNRTIISPTINLKKEHNDEAKKIVNYIYNNNLAVRTQDIKLTVEVEQPTVGYLYGIAKFQLTPKQYDGSINISNLSNGKIKKIFLENLSQQVYIYTELEPGKYIATYYGEEEYKFSNTVSFSIEGQKNVNNEKNDQPIIERIGHDLIEVTSNNLAHTHVVCTPIKDNTRYRYFTSFIALPEENKEIVVELKSKKALIPNLMPNAQYAIKTTDLKNNFSKTTVALTLAYEKQDTKLFLDYIKNNQKLLINSYDKYADILEKIKTANVSNLIDSLTIQESSTKTQELLLYAIKFQNEFNALFNSSSLSMPTKVLSAPFWDVLKHDDEAIKTNYFYTKKRKNFFDSSVSYPTIHKFEGATNRRYYTYDIKEDTSRGVRADFCSFNDDIKAQLEPYKRTDMMYQLDISNYKNMYPKASTQALYETACRNEKQANIRMLKGPVVTYNEDMLTVDVDYTEVLGQTPKTFYLVLSEITEALDYTPVRKINFTGNMTKLTIDKYVSGVLDDKTYLAWIENDNYDIISDSTVFKTYNDTFELDYINGVDIDKELGAIKKAMESKMGKDQVIDTIFAYVESKQPNKKRLYEVLAQETINYLYNQLKSDTYILELLKTEFDRIHYMKNLCEKVVYNKNDKSIKFVSEKPVHIALLEYTANDELPKKNTKNIESLVLLDESKNYTLVYLVESSLIATSGFILINNSTGTAYAHNINMEVI